MELAIETVGETSSVAVSDSGQLLGEITWVSGRRHTPSLVPMIERVCVLADPDGEASAARARLEVVIVDVGPGAYGGIRAGMAAAIGLAAALDLQCVGVGRLELQSYTHAAAGSATAIHRASRRSWVWQTFTTATRSWIPQADPSLGSIDDLLEALATTETGPICGDTDLLDAEQRERLAANSPIIEGAAQNVRRASLLAELGHRHWREGRALPPAALEPLYLREPAIGPQPTP